jgi:hypothetical protein
MIAATVRARGSRDAQRAVLEVHVSAIPAELSELAIAHERVDRNRDRAPPPDRDVLARDEFQELARVEELLGLAVASLRRLDVAGRLP